MKIIEIFDISFILVSWPVCILIVYEDSGEKVYLKGHAQIISLERNLWPVAAEVRASIAVLDRDANWNVKVHQRLTQCEILLPYFIYSGSHLEDIYSLRNGTLIEFWLWNC